MRRTRVIRGALLAALVLFAGHPSPGRAQQERPPLEDVTLRGRVLRPDGKPLANTSLRVDARRSASGFAIFGFFFTGGISAFSCFDSESELCPLPNSKRFDSTTDANGNYSFTFPKAKRRGEQTDTDYFLSIAMASRAAPDKPIIGTYELELLDPVHNAPDLVMWDPNARIKPRARAYEVVFEPRADSSNRVSVALGDAQVKVDGTSINARDIEDSVVWVSPTASKDVRVAGTIYHQRFSGAPIALRGALVPLSRGRPCTAVRADGTQQSPCRYTDGDLASPAMDGVNACSYDFDTKRYTTTNAAGQTVPCEPSVTIDLGAPSDVSEIRARGCGCTYAGSSDGTNWTELPSGTLGRARSFRFVRVSGQNVAGANEVSVWPPWPNDVGATPLADESSIPTTPLAPDPSSGDQNNRTRVAWLLALVAIAGLAIAARRVWATARRSDG